ncbi:peptidase [Salinigranum sp. GCM10025319]|uniref:peptidase n=1 Tax=Salinigranum sp. GCM10025319 TaxID=3252687 RepID=UPI0036061496
MVLQSTPPALAVPAVLFIVLLVVGFILGAIGSAVVRRLSNPVGKYRLFYLGILLPYTLLSYGVLALLAFGPALTATLPVTTTGPVGTVVADCFGFLAAGLVGLAAYTPTIRGVRSARDIDLSTSIAVARMVRFVLGASVVLAVVLLPVRLWDVTESPIGLSIGLAVVVGVIIGGSPWIITALRRTTKPTGETADRLDALRGRAGLDVRDVRILDTTDEETANALVRGPPRYRRLFVTSTFLDRFDDETAAALLSVQAGRVRAHLLVRQAGTVIVAAGFLVGAVTGFNPRWLLLAAAGGAVLGGFWLTRRGVRAADDYAAEQVGASTVADAFERYAAVHSMDPSRRRVQNPLSVNVALGDRIDRLRE